MRFSDESYNLRTELDTKHYEPAPGEIERLEENLRPLRELTREFPVSDLYITVERSPRSQQIHVTMALRVPSRTLFTGERSEAFHAAVERCIRKLVKKVSAHKEILENKPEIERAETGGVEEVVPAWEPDMEAIEHAWRTGDYRTFREKTYGYEEHVRKRAGRWIQRYPQAEAQLGEEITLADVVEEVFLNAFERYDERPKTRLGEWLESLIDDSIQALLEDPDAEKQNVSFARTLLETPRRAD